MKISVALANYNHAAFIEQCIEGVRSQTYSDWELLIDDDGSRDASKDIIEAAARRDPRIQPRFFAENRGAMTAVKVCSERADGELIMGIAADDYITNPHFFANAVAAFRRFPQISGVFARAALVDGNTGEQFWCMGHYGDKTVMSPPSKTQFIAPEKVMPAFLTDRLFIPGNSAIWRNALFKAYGGYDAALGAQSDYYLNHALAAKFGVVYISETVAVARAFKTGYSRSASNEDVFRRHALVEHKLRALDLPYKVDDRLYAAWRAFVVSGRVPVDMQWNRFDAIRKACGNLASWEEREFSPEFLDLLRRIEGECAATVQQSQATAALALRVFDEIAGPIDGLSGFATLAGPNPHAKPRRWWQRLSR